MYIPCNIYCENYLGGRCNKKCDNCYGGKEVYECIEDFEVCGDTILDTVKIKKGEWFWIKAKNRTHVILANGTDHLLWLCNEYFEKYFTDRFIADHSLRIRR